MSSRRVPVLVSRFLQLLSYCTVGVVCIIISPMVPWGSCCIAAALRRSSLPAPLHYLEPTTADAAAAHSKLTHGRQATTTASVPPPFRSPSSFLLFLLRPLLGSPLPPARPLASPSSVFFPEGSPPGSSLLRPRATEQQDGGGQDGPAAAAVRVPSLSLAGG
ncbi:hypothetical protein GUJ93_ZPchr0012g19426 [Zizania palustris]|uniref:Uncharacterized protein n=1 Tax=Zizania palustris TaxID=103762 RepID=A0A8J5WR82_ZIZPA|nr:hypothetical protein GUJ93_ZPchr0012g19426 [Zizania palustris]